MVCEQGPNHPTQTVVGVFMADVIDFEEKFKQNPVVA
jgi:hypothetical protein